MIRITWSPRRPPLDPEAVILPRQSLVEWRRTLFGRALVGVSFSGGLVVLGREDSLPWLPGAAYFAPSPAARDVFVPTGLAPSVPEQLLASAAKRQFSELIRSPGNGEGELGGPLLLSPAGWASDRAYLVSLGAALPIDDDVLARWLESTP